MDIRCKLGLHKWMHNTEKVKDGTIRTCIRCSREEIYLTIFNKWRLCLKGYSIIVPKGVIGD